MLLSYKVNESQSSSVTIWTEMETMVFSEIRQKQKGNDHMISFMFNFKTVKGMNKVVGVKGRGWGWVKLKEEDWPMVAKLLLDKTEKFWYDISHGHLKMPTKYCTARREDIEIFHYEEMINI